MSLLVTGGHGFVMSNLVRHWLDGHPREHVVLLDRDAPDQASTAFFGGRLERIHWIRADILDRATWQDAAREQGVDRIVHGAALTPHPWSDLDGTLHDPERAQPGRVVDVNLGGTLAVLDFARSLPACTRLVLVSTGAVYPAESPDGNPIRESGSVAPSTLYGISKYAAELVARRYAELFGLSIVAARLASVYGPMDRMLPSRHVVCAPNRVTALALAGVPIRLDGEDGVGDWIHAADVAAALTLLLDADEARHTVYNVASGCAETLARLAALTTALVPGATWSVDPGRANVQGDVGRSAGRWGAYDIARMRDEFGWAPQPLVQRLTEYIAWRECAETMGGPI